MPYFSFAIFAIFENFCSLAKLSQIGNCSQIKESNDDKNSISSAGLCGVKEERRGGVLVLILEGMSYVHLSVRCK